MIVREPIEYLRVFLSKRQQETLSPQDVAYILKVAAREVLPAAGLKGRCPQLDLFTDWTVHGEIERSTAASAAIAKIAEAIPLHGQDGRDNKWFEEQVNEAVSFAALRLDIVALCRQFDIPDALFTTWESWQRWCCASMTMGSRGGASRPPQTR